AILRQSYSFWSDRVWERNAKSHLYTLLFLREIVKSLTPKPVDSLILGVGGIPPRRRKQKEKRILADASPLCENLPPA
ncbi:MAG TPA: hypothetical protein VJH94_02555, partial [Candidatus Paceibacterota bacterium]